MRLWSLHPKYLDSKGLVALWRETLLAKNVLEGNTKGYTQHPQLIRFKNSKSPIHAIHQYLAEIYNEATARGYKFDSTKINFDFEPIVLKVNSKQLEYEFEHLKRKLVMRDADKLKQIETILFIETAAIFEIVEGEIESWEII